MQLYISNVFQQLGQSNTSTPNYLTEALNAAIATGAAELSPTTTTTANNNNNNTIGDETSPSASVSESDRVAASSFATRFLGHIEQHLLRD